MLEFIHGYQSGDCDQLAAQRWALEQTEKLNPTLGALREWRHELKEVRDGPLSGVTVSAKDNIAVDGMQTWAGSAKALPDEWTKSGSFVRRLEALGAVVTSKSNCAEFALGGSGYNPNQGTPRNPWSKTVDLVPGGSSSGTAVAVASGMAMLGIGTDTGGSVRVPAALCGCVGYRASLGHWAMDGIVPLLTRSDTLGLMTRDVSSLLYAVSAIDNVDNIYAAPLESISVAVWPKQLMQNCEPERAALLQTTCDALEKNGCVLTTAGQDAIDLAFKLLNDGPNSAAIEFSHFLNRELPSWRPVLNRQVAAMVAEHEFISEATQAERNKEFLKLADHLESFFDGADFVLSPSTALAPPATKALETPEGYEHYSNGLLGYTVMGSMFQCCGISIPAGLDKNGLPMSLQLLGRANDDKRLLSVALSLQSLLPTMPSPTT